ncbi:hypothetical protein TeGR_g6727 [Tetraparma gracilis]|uniref:Cyclic nucleotide-binding domain-containing protein n=1 Tax=Tetraparma gracilis TaxID=2962635 RepID=A0ABQ6MU25_9STRA|nr:hypothetical protein TeGR_g6727 [Tetraparma gracilis]
MDTVKHISFFAEVDETVMGEICLSLKTLIFLPHDMILFKGDVGKELFIVAKGVVEVVRDDLPAEKRKNASPILLRSGSFFGEIALIMEVRRTCSVQAKTVCEINILLQRTFDDILREHPDFAKRMNELVVARQLETSLARADGGGSMKIRQADLNYANKRVEQTMMTGLRQRASGQGAMLRKGSISKKVFPNFVEDQEMDGNPAKDEVSDTPPNRKSILRGDSFIAKGMGALKSVTEKAKTVASPSSKSVAYKEGEASPKERSRTSDTHSYYGDQPAINTKAPHERENTMENIFDDLERRKSVGEVSLDKGKITPLEGPPTPQVAAATTVQVDAAEAALVKERGGVGKRGSTDGHIKRWQSTGHFIPGADQIDLGKVHGSILAGGDDDDDDDDDDDEGEDEEETEARASNDEKVEKAMRKSMKGGGGKRTSIKRGAGKGAEIAKVRSGVQAKQIHARMSRTEKMLEAMMSKLDINLDDMEGGGKGGGGKDGEGDGTATT